MYVAGIVREEKKQNPISDVWKRNQMESYLMT